MTVVQATFLNGRLELLQPVDWPDGTLAEVIPLPAAGSGSSENPTSLASWPPRFFEQTSGAFAGEPIERPAQGDLPSRDQW
jgi:hypothetical protein